MSTGAEVGFYGKLPSHGDFLRRRVSDAFVGAWDGWLQAGLAASRQALGDRWLEIYLTSPAWRFATAPGACGTEPLVGVMAPSVDRVGRYFPLAVVAELPHTITPLAAAAAAWRFFEAAERLVVETLASDVVDFAQFDAAVTALAADLPDTNGPSPVSRDTAALLSGSAAAAWQMPIASARSMGSAFDRMLGEHLALVYEPLVVWCTDGSSMVQPSGLVTRGLPHPELFAGLLDGSWTQHHWRSVAAGMAPRQGRALTEHAGGDAVVWTSAGVTHAGLVRSVNQDALIDRPEAAIWAVADGLGGLRDGEIASRMVCDALADLVPESGIEDAIDAVRARLSQVNEYLVRAATRPVQAVQSGSTVVALVVRGARCAVLWAGDSRAYRWREGRLEALTQDHGLDELEVLAGGAAHAVTRAVGGDATLALDVHRDDVRPGDRYLLCSDGLTRTVTDAEMGRCLDQADVRRAADDLVALALRAGAPDNVTALVVAAQPDPAVR